jgi:hypothetical protein
MTTNAHRMIALSLVLCAACTDNVAKERSRPTPAPDDSNEPYVPPTDVQLTPPEGRTSDTPTVGMNTTRKVVDLDVDGAGNRKLRATLVGDQGQRSLAVALPDESLIEFARADFHVTTVAAADESGNLMICWNTLTGRTTAYSPNSPDPATGMALHCRRLDAQNQLASAVRIPSPTVGCWIQQVVALPGGGFRLLYTGDDGWFDGDPKNPLHGTYEAYFDADTWTKPQLLLPVPDPAVVYEMPDEELPDDSDPSMPGATEP